MTNTNKHSRWAAWEKGVLAKVDPTLDCLEVIEQRRREVDDDANEADVVRDGFRRLLRQHEKDPDRCYVFLNLNQLCQWIEDSTGDRKSKLKVTSYLRTLGIPELTEERRNDARGWRWKGVEARPSAELELVVEPTDFED